MHRDTEGSVKLTTPPPSQEPSPRDYLDSWKAIAFYLNRTVRTVQRWEKTERLPVWRHRHLKGNSVHSSKREIDEWRKRRSLAVDQSPRSKLAPNRDTMCQLPQPILLGLAPEADSAQRVALRSSHAEPCAVFILYCIAAVPLSSGDSKNHRVGASELSSSRRNLPDGPALSAGVTLQRASWQEGKKCTI